MNPCDAAALLQKITEEIEESLRTTPEDPKVKAAFEWFASWREKLEKERSPSAEAKRWCTGCGAPESSHPATGRMKQWPYCGGFKP